MPKLRSKPLSQWQREQQDVGQKIQRHTAPEKTLLFSGTALVWIPKGLPLVFRKGNTKAPDYHSTRLPWDKSLHGTKRAPEEDSLWVFYHGSKDDTELFSKDDGFVGFEIELKLRTRDKRVENQVEKWRYYTLNLKPTTKEIHHRVQFYPKPQFDDLVFRNKNISGVFYTPDNNGVGILIQKLRTPHDPPKRAPKPAPPLTIP